MGPRATNDRPWRPSSSQATSESGLPERRADTGCSMPGDVAPSRLENMTLATAKKPLTRTPVMRSQKSRSRPPAPSTIASRRGMRRPSQAEDGPEQQPQRPRHDQEQRRHADGDADDDGPRRPRHGLHAEQRADLVLPPHLPPGGEQDAPRDEEDQDPPDDRAGAALQLGDLQVVPQRLAAGPEAVADHQGDAGRDALHVPRAGQQRGLHGHGEEQAGHEEARPRERRGEHARPALRWRGRGRLGGLLRRGQVDVDAHGVAPCPAAGSVCGSVSAAVDSSAVVSSASTSASRS